MATMRSRLVVHESEGVEFLRFHYSLDHPSASRLDLHLLDRLSILRHAHVHLDPPILLVVLSLLPILGRDAP